MSRAYVELSGESPALARAELAGALEALGGAIVDEPGVPEPLVAVALPEGQLPQLAARLGLAHRCLIDAPDFGAPLGAQAPRGSASFRPFGRPSGGGVEPAVHTAARTWTAAGGRIDLAHPERRFWGAGLPGGVRWYEEAAPVDRRATAARAISALPFQRPVGLAPRLARAAANLARAGPGRSVLDPFLGTGALLAEAGLLGGRIFGIDRDAAMVRGALQNFAFLGVEAAGLAIGDAAEVEPPGTPPRFDALLSDPPYGRASSTRGELAAALLARVLPRWIARLRPDGVAVLVVPAGSGPELTGCRLEASVEVRVHRSLTREFRLYRRGPDGEAAAPGWRPPAGSERAEEGAEASERRPGRSSGEGIPPRPGPPATAG